MASDSPTHSLLSYTHIHTHTHTHCQSHTEHRGKSQLREQPLCVWERPSFLKRFTAVWTSRPLSLLISTPWTCLYGPQHETKDPNQAFYSMLWSGSGLSYKLRRWQLNPLASLPFKDKRRIKQSQTMYHLKCWNILCLCICLCLLSLPSRDSCESSKIPSSSVKGKGIWLCGY